jgi:hypothetical protein
MNAAQGGIAGRVVPLAALKEAAIAEMVDG